MKISNDDQKAIGVVMFCVGFLCFLIGIGGRFKSDYHSQGEIASTAFTAALILAAIGVILFLFSLRKTKG
jgi:hypothetical protein